MVKKRLRSLVTGSLVCGAASLPAFAEDTDVAALRAEMAQMRAELAEVKARSGATWMDEAREAEMKAMVEAMIADANTRTAFQEGGLGAGHDGKTFHLEGEGFRMNIGGQIQFRYVSNNSDARGETNLDGLEIRRGKLGFTGYIADPKLEYTFVFAADRDRPANAADIFLEDAVISYKFDNGWKIKAGRMKLPFLYEELLSSKRFLAIDRGLSTEFFTLNRAEQIQLEVPVEDLLKLYLAYSDGGNSDGTQATSDTAEYAVTARVQSKLAGDWGQLKDLVAYQDDFAAFLGGAVHVEKQEGAGADEVLAWTVDGIVKTGNLVLMGAVMGASGDVDDRDQFGLLAQAGYNFTKEFQPFLRYDFIDDDTVDELNAVTAGFNYFLKGHSAKFTADVVYVIEPENPSAVSGINGGEFSSGVGLSSADLNGEDDQFAVRAQFQLLF